MTIPALSTSDKSFICSYVIGSNVDHRLAIGVINEITTYTTEYIDGFCWIPVCSPDETNDESWYWDVGAKDVVYVKIGVRVSADGYIHTWLTSTQAISELILWNNNYDEHNAPVNDTTTLHWVIEKIYYQVIGNITGFNYNNIKFQKYQGNNRLYLFGNHTNTGFTSLRYSGTGTTHGGITWYPTNTTVIDDDILYAAGATSGGVNTTPWYADTYYDIYRKITAFPTNGRIYEAVYDGTTASSPPTFNPNIGSSTTDGTIHWRCCSVEWKGKYVYGRVGADGWCQVYDGDTPWGIPPDATKPIGWLDDVDTIHSKVFGISKHCEPGVCDFMYYDLSNSHIRSATGIPSGRRYTAWQTVSTAGDPNTFPYPAGIDGNGVPGSPGGAIDECENTAYIWVPGYCNGASGSGPSECEENGGHWVPGHYACDPTFDYDIGVTVTYTTYKGAIIDDVDYFSGRVHFPTLNEGDSVRVLYRYYSQSIIDTFIESEGDLDNLRNFILNSTQYNSGTIICRYTNHVGMGILTTGLTISYADWKVMWGVNDYFSSWQAPDGLLARSPGTSQTLLTRPLTHHDEFYTGGTDVTGGFLYEPITSNAFLSRSIDAEIKIDYPVCLYTDFCWLYVPDTSDAFIWREIDAESKVESPMCDSTDFCWVYIPRKTYIHFDRTVSTETKIDFPLSNRCDFSFLYRLLEPKIAVLYYLKTTGDDSKDGRSWPNAWRHWSYMAQNMPYEGYTVLVMDGVYDTGETQIGPDNSTVVFLVDSAGEDNPAVVTVKL